MMCDYIFHTTPSMWISRDIRDIYDLTGNFKMLPATIENQT